MSEWRLSLTVCILSLCSCLLLAYEDDIEVNFADNYFNEITDDVPETPEPTPTSVPCSSGELTKWDKLFSMLENSQMRENMLLQYADDIMKVEMGSLRKDISRFIDQYGGSCGTAVETAGRRVAMQLEGRLRENQVKNGDQTPATAGNYVGNSDNVKLMLRQLLSAAETQASRLTKLENSCFSDPGAGAGRNIKTRFQHLESGGAGHPQQEVTPVAEPLDGALAELQQTKEKLEEVLRSMRRRSLPAGCEMAIHFPTRSRRIHTSVTPDAPMSVSAFTICMWLKPTTTNSNKTVLFAYGSHNNMYEIELMLSHNSAIFNINGELHLLEARDVVRQGEWTHLCGTWSSDQGLAALWADGKEVASTAGLAEGHVIPDHGSMQLGQVKTGCCRRGGLQGFQDPRNIAFAGKMTGVNMWDRVLSKEEISQMALHEGEGCELRGNIVAWGVTEMVPQDGADFVF